MMGRGKAGELGLGPWLPQVAKPRLIELKRRGESEQEPAASTLAASNGASSAQSTTHWAAPSAVDGDEGEH